MELARRMLFALAAGLLAACGQAAPGADPVSTVQALYAPYEAGLNPSDLRRGVPWTDEMKTLFEEADARAEKLDAQAIDFDPIIDGQDYEITDLAVEAQGAPADGRAVVDARFKNFGDDVKVTFDLAEAGGGWRVDNIRTEAWNLRELLAGGGG